MVFPATIAVVPPIAIQTAISMRSDLLDAQAAIKWAEAQTDILEQRLKSWLDGGPYQFFSEPHPEMGKALIKLRVREPLPLIAIAEAGAIINSIRSSLDLLAAALAWRNNVKPSTNTHFPFFHSIHDFIDPKNGLEAKKWLSLKEKTILKTLRPYRGGNDILFSLTDLDNTRKHERLLVAHPLPHQITISPDTYAEGFEFIQIWPGFNDEAVIATTAINARNTDFQLVIDVFFNETARIPQMPVLAALRNFAGAANGIIGLFNYS